MMNVGNIFAGLFRVTFIIVVHSEGKVGHVLTMLGRFRVEAGLSPETRGQQRTDRS